MQDLGDFRYWLIYRWVVVLTLGMAVECKGQILQEGFCGEKAAKACVRDLGVNWSDTQATKLLTTNENVSFHELDEAIKSLGLYTFPCTVDRHNLYAIHQIYLRNASHLSGIAWLNSQESTNLNDQPQGHFVVANVGHVTNGIAYYDPETNIVGLVKLKEDKYLPLLIVSAKPIIWPGIVSAVSRLPIQILTSPVTTVAIALLGVAVMLRIKTGSFNFKAKTVAMNILIIVLTGSAVCAYPLLKSQFIFFEDQSIDRLSFSQPEYDLGEMLVNGEASGIVTLFNNTDSPIKVDRLVGNCGCMKLEPAQFEMAGNEEKQIVVRFSGIAVGRNDFTVSAISNGKPVQCHVYLQGAPSTSIVPLRIMIGKLPVKDVTVLFHEVKVQDYHGKPQSLVSVENASDGKLLYIELLPKAMFANKQTIAMNVSLARPTPIRGVYFERFLVTAGEGQSRVACQAEIGVEITD